VVRYPTWPNNSKIINVESQAPQLTFPTFFPVPRLEPVSEPGQNRLEIRLSQRAFQALTPTFASPSSADQSSKGPRPRSQRFDLER
jgi:hypothetical protein